MRQASCICPRAVAKVNDTPEPEPEGVKSMPPNLEEFIPGERLPDIIDVYVNKDFLFRTWPRAWDLSTSQLERPIKFVRQYPRRTCIDKGKFNSSTLHHDSGGSGFIGSTTDGSRCDQMM